MMKLNFRILVVLFTLLLHGSIWAKTDSNFIISSDAIVSELVVLVNENIVVKTAVSLFCDDVQTISGKQLVVSEESSAQFQIKVGTIGINKEFDKQCEKSGIDIKSLKSEWEGYVIQIILDKKSKTYKLYVVGSQPRGTAYGLMELSRQIGISPWIWWNDVIPEKRKTLELANDLFIQDAPKVRFRGIFLNDEDWGLQPWAAKTFEPEMGDIGPKTYARIFELLLRLKANAIWPAMHKCTRAFFTYPKNIEMADKYGVWVGSSHCEPMLRNNVDEWHRWNPSDNERGEWNFDTNPAKVSAYWTERVKETAEYDGIYTIGMRGIHDGRMPGGKNMEDKVQILNNIFTQQQNILTTIKGKDAAYIPQVFCPYKEVLEVYRAGAKVPEDVTIMWADDNHGYIRQLSSPEEQKRSGGGGVYYHISYWGRPHDYLWLESMPVSLIWEEMHKAWETNSRNLWIVNVGDIKPNEIGMNFFLDMAWDPERFQADSLSFYYTDFAKSQFGEAYANEIGTILEKYFQLGFSRKPEHMAWNKISPYTEVQNPELSLFYNGDEVQKRINAYNALEEKVDSLYKILPEYMKDAFFQLVAYKVKGASLMNKKLLYAYKSRVYGQQQRNSTNLYAQKAEKAFADIKNITAYYNDSLVDGKWKYMMSYNPRNLKVFEMPETSSFLAAKANNMFVYPEEQEKFDSINYILPTFLSATNKSYFIDISNAGTAAVNWTAKADDSWIELSKESGTFYYDERIWVSVNWGKITKEGVIESQIEISSGNITYSVNVKANKVNLTNESASFIEDNGCVSIEAENYDQNSSINNRYWNVIEGLGRCNDAIGAYPIHANALKEDNLSEAAWVSYNIHTFSEGEALLRFYCLPNHPINQTYELRFAVSIDDGKPFIMNAGFEEMPNEHTREWQDNVLSSAAIKEIRQNIKSSGNHTIKIQMVDPGVVIDKVELYFTEPASTYFGAIETKNKQ